MALEGRSSSQEEPAVILIVVKHPVRPAFADSWLAEVGELTTGTRAEPGSLFFDWYRSADDPNCWLLVEGFADAAAGAAHVASSHFKATIARMPDLLDGAPEIVHVEVPDGWSVMAELAPRRVE
jgi:quinol monooxygenase YgiN